MVVIYDPEKAVCSLCILPGSTRGPLGCGLSCEALEAGVSVGTPGLVFLLSYTLPKSLICLFAAAMGGKEKVWGGGLRGGRMVQPVREGIGKS